MDGIVPFIFIGIAVDVFLSGVIIFYSTFVLFAKKKVSKLCYLAIKANLIFNLILLPVVLMAAQTIIGYGPLPYIFYLVLAISVPVFFLAKQRLG